MHYLISSNILYLVLVMNKNKVPLRVVSNKTKSQNVKLNNQKLVGEEAENRNPSQTSIVAGCQLITLTNYTHQTQFPSHFFFLPSSTSEQPTTSSNHGASYQNLRRS